MLYVFWWSGRGYLTPVIVFVILCLFGLVLQASQSFIHEGLWFWGLALLAAAAINWHVGSRINRKKLAKLRPRTLQNRLFYRARHRFMSMPMEASSVVIALVGAGVIVYGLI